MAREPGAAKVAKVSSNFRHYKNDIRPTPTVPFISILLLPYQTTSQEADLLDVTDTELLQAAGEVGYGEIGRWTTYNKKHMDVLVF